MRSNLNQNRRTYALILSSLFVVGLLLIPSVLAFGIPSSISPSLVSSTVNCTGVFTWCVTTETISGTQEYSASNSTGTYYGYAGAANTNAGGASGTNASQVINAASLALGEYGGLVEISQGYYPSSGTLYVYDKETLSCAAPYSANFNTRKGCVIFQDRKGTNYFLVQAEGGNSSNYLNGVSLVNINLLGNTYSGSGVNITYVSEPYFSNLFVDDFSGYGIYYEHANDPQYNNVLLSNDGNYSTSESCLDFNGVSDAYLYATTISSCAYISIYAPSAADFHLIGVSIADSQINSYTFSIGSGGSSVRDYVTSMDIDVFDSSGTSDIIFDNAANSTYSDVQITDASGNYVWFKNGGDSQLNNVYIGCHGCTGIVASNSAVVQVNNYNTNASLALYTSGGTIIATNSYPLPASSTVTAGTSTWTYTNSDPYQEILVLSTANGISSWSCNGVSGLSTTEGVSSCYLSYGQSMTVAWSSTAPVFTKVPQQ